MLAAHLYEAGLDVSLLARGRRLASLRQYGVQLAEEDSPAIRQVPVPVVEHAAGGYDLAAITVRTHQVDAALESLTDFDGDVLFLHDRGGRCTAAGRSHRERARAARLPSCRRHHGRRRGPLQSESLHDQPIPHADR
ncbi:ketopantoate reductase family protein [[Kitasatospora] papulosa]|uniref:ketopantoate reductase family protein n=1 Tax=[Kitasatospora] papulosa TaxID=1464011 RepID=UPI003685BB69